MAEEKEAKSSVKKTHQQYSQFDCDDLSIAIERSDVTGIGDLVYLEMDNISIVIEVHKSDIVVHDDFGGRVRARDYVEEED